jgi:hypothetical protein
MHKFLHCKANSSKDHVSDHLPIRIKILGADFKLVDACFNGASIGGQDDKWYHKESKSEDPQK